LSGPLLCKSMSLRSVILSVRNPLTSAKFYERALGLVVKYQTPASVELTTNGSMPIPIIIKEATNAATLMTGYTPILNFDVTDMDQSIMIAMEMGAMLDGAIKYKAYGKVAALRTPDGHMIGLFEPASDLSQ
jgi:hypothetical protein